MSNLKTMNKFDSYTRPVTEDKVEYLATSYVLLEDLDFFIIELHVEGLGTISFRNANPDMVLLVAGTAMNFSRCRVICASDRESYCIQLSDGNCIKVVKSLYTCMMGLNSNTTVGRLRGMLAAINGYKVVEKHYPSIID